MKIFLGGTCNDSTWRSRLIPRLKCDYFNPVVENWTEECVKIEEEQKLICDKLLFVITPLQTGYYSFAEIISCSYEFPEKLIVCFSREDQDNFLRIHNFDDSRWLSLTRINDIYLKKKNIPCFWNLEDLGEYLNSL